MSETNMVKWPGENTEGPWSAEQVMRWLASEGLAAAARSVSLLPRGPDDELGTLRHIKNFLMMDACHNLYMALEALRALDPATADEVADRCVLAAVCGDSYGEWLWQWATDCGLDADAISEEARAAVSVPNQGESE